MRILVVSDLPHFVTGGAEMQAARLIEAWLDAGHEVRCLGRRMGPGPVRIGRHDVVVGRIRTTSLFGRYGRAASYFLSLAWWLLRERRWADVVYTRFLGEAAATAALLKACGLLRAPLVATPANTHGEGDVRFLQSLPGARAVIRLLDRECDAINLIAEDMAAELEGAGFSRDRFTRIPNGITVRPAPARGVSDGHQWIAVGRLTPQKGFDVLLSALALVRDGLRPRQVWIVGDGPERDRLKAQADMLGLDEHVAWLGERPQAEVAELLAQADLFLLPSRYEGLSNAGLEALERALPIVATACGGLDRYLSPDTGWVVPPDDAAALSQALRSALSTSAEDLSRMGHAARHLAEAHFDMRVVSAQYLELFARLMTEGTA